MTALIWPWKRVAASATIFSPPEMLSVGFWTVASHFIFGSLFDSSAWYCLTWKAIGRSKPDAQVLEYRTPQDGEYWFAVQTLDNESRLFPPKTAVMEPGIKVIVDTVPPTLSLDSNGRRGSLASVRWEIRDERLDRGSFILEYQAQGARDWRQVPVRKPTPLIGEVTFDAGTAEPIQVRAQVSDRAKNTADAALWGPIIKEANIKPE